MLTQKMQSLGMKLNVRGGSGRRGRGTGRKRPDTMSDIWNMDISEEEMGQEDQETRQDEDENVQEDTG